MNTTNVIIVHGSYGHPEENWFGWLAQKLNQADIPCYVPQLPTPERQSLENWCETFDRLVEQVINEKTILIGHSLGAIFLFRWLEMHHHQIYSLISIGAFIGQIGLPKFDEINHSFFASTFNWNSIASKISHTKANSNSIFCYYGTNDPYVSRPMFDFIADHLNARKIIVSEAGHFNIASGYFQFPLLYYHLQRIMECL